MSRENKILIINRKTGAPEEEAIFCEPALRFLYGTGIGKMCCSLISRNPVFSQFAGWWQRRAFTKKNIKPFVEQYKINTSDFATPLDNYTSFDDFFTRHLKKEARPIQEGLIIPADGRYLFYQNIESCDGFVVKNRKFTLQKLLGSSKLAERYQRGSMAIARLAPCDYHRFHFPIESTPSQAELINGPLFSVNPIAIRQNIELLSENKRMITLLETQNYGSILFLEIGATTVGSIHQTFTPYRPYQKGDEKGYFSFGGSSIILLFEENRITFAPDLLQNSTHHTETLCLFGQSMEKELFK